MIASELKEIRESLGFSSARSFYQEHLSRKTKLEFNYSYYMKIEGRKALPSPAVIQAIAATLQPDQQSKLILAYCQNLFPKHARLFTHSPSTPTATSAKPRKVTAKPSDSSDETLLVKPRYLTEAQVACLARSREIYYIFLILTLARTAVPVAELQARIGTMDVSKSLAQLEAAKLAHVEAAKLAHVEGSTASSSVKEMKFPEAETESLKKLYRSIDQWNLEFPQELKFAQPFNKMLLRRVSRRYQSLIVSQINLMLDLVRASDEVHQDYNGEVIMLNVSLSQGRLPG